MEKELTSERKAKKLLEQEKQEKLRLHRQIEEAEEEEKVRLRRIKDRERMAFITYMKLREDEKNAAMQQEEHIRKLQMDFRQQYLYQTQLFNKTMLNSIRRHEANTAEFLFADQSKEELVQHQKHMEAAEIDASEYQTLAMAELCRNPENVEDIEKVFRGERPSETLTLQRRDSLNRTDEALEQYSKGDIKKLENALKECLMTACHAFAHTKDTLDAIHWSKQINGILSVVSTHKVLFKNGADTQIMETATGMAALGRVMENGLEALDELCTAQLNRTPLTQEKEMNLQAQILLMQQSDIQRSNEQYRKLFAKGYHPKNGLNSEQMKKLFKELNDSQAFHMLSSMEQDKRLFALIDPESRMTLCERLFSPHTEKTSAVKENKVSKSAPALKTH